MGVSELLQLPLPTAEKVFNVHDVCPGDLGVLPEFGPYPGQEAGLLFASSQEVPVQGEHLFLELAMAPHGASGRLVDQGGLVWPGDLI